MPIASKTRVESVGELCYSQLCLSISHSSHFYGEFGNIFTIIHINCNCYCNYFLGQSY